MTSPPRHLLTPDAEYFIQQRARISTGGVDGHPYRPPMAHYGVTIAAGSAEWLS